jgi:hypothetical protein
MSVSRREFLQAGLAAGGLLILRPTGALAASLPSIDHYGTPRASRLVPNSWVVHADMHNHSQFSDGAGDPLEFYASTRTSGLDAAALTDHATLADGLPESPCTVFAAQADAHAGCNSLAGLHEGTWQRTRQLADQHDAAGTFTAVRGFEWSSPTLGHMNVWFSEEFTDPLHTGGLGTPDDLARFAETEGFPFSGEAADALQAILAATPAAGLGMRAWYEWLKSDPATAVLGGGADGIFGFNHPGREPGRFSDFAFDAGLVERCVSLELFNKNEDYFFELTDVGRPSPLIACLDAGWKPGLLGVSDYHGTDWGFPEDRGRAGMWVDRLDRGGLREAMENRRFFATNLKGLRLDATANGARMGSIFGHRQGVVSFALDIDRGPAWYGHELHVQVLQTGSVVPTIVDDVTIRVPRPDQPVVTFDVPIDVANGRWIVLRVTDPEAAVDGRATPEYAGLGGAIAYASPFYLDPDLAPRPAPVDPPGAVEPTPLPSPAAPPTPPAPALPAT